jgi:hypothetical protein
MSTRREPTRPNDNRTNRTTDTDLKKPMRTNDVKRSDTMYLLHEALSKVRMRRAPRWRTLPYRPALQVAARARHQY